MKHLYFTFCFLLIGTLLACQTDPKPTESATIIPTPREEASPTSPVATPATPDPTTTNTAAATSVPAETTTEEDTEETEAYDPDRDVTVGTIKNACELISEAEIRRLVPGFSKAKEIQMNPRNSPDNHASACECRAVGENKAVVIGYRKNPANLQYIDDIIAKGEVREYAPNIPPYEPVKGLGQKAAFNTKHGYMKWVGDNGVLVYMYVFPTTVQTVDLYKEVLYKWAQDINARFSTK